MFHRRTVFVVGAGASAEAELPIGSELAKQISNLLSFSSDWDLTRHDHVPYPELLRRHCENTTTLDEYIALSRQIARGLLAVDSIDKYIDTHRHDSRIASIAKAAIIHTILRAERASLFLKNQPLTDAGDPLRRFADTWYFPFGRMVIDGIPLGEIHRLFENITIVCFNYDRCIEEFLSHWLATAYAISLPKSRQVVSRLTIVRPYGQVAPIEEVALGDTALLSESFSLSKNINTFNEHISDHAVMSSIKNAMADAETIVFLGFGFHEPNMEILKPDRPTRVSRILTSGRGIKLPNATTIAQELQQLFGPRDNPRSLPVNIPNNGDCRSLFDMYSRSMNPAA